MQEACRKSGGTFEQQGRCACPPGLKSSWDAGTTLLFCTEIDTVGIADSKRVAQEEPSFWDQVVSCESPMLSVGVVVGIFLLVMIPACCCVGFFLLYRRKRPSKPKLNR